MCNVVEKHINIFLQKISIMQRLQHQTRCKTFDNKDKISIQRKIYYAKNRDKLLQKQIDYRNKRNTEFKDLVRSYAELQKKFKASEKYLIINKWLRK